MTQDKVWEGQRGERKGDKVQRLLDRQLMKGWEVKARGPGSQVRLPRIIPWSSSFTVPFCLSLFSIFSFSFPLSPPIFPSYPQLFTVPLQPAPLSGGAGCAPSLGLALLAWLPKRICE